MKEVRDEEARFDIRRVEAKGDKARVDLFRRVEESERLAEIIDGSWGLKEQVKELWRRFLEIEKGWDSKFVRVEAHWEERKEDDKP